MALVARLTGRRNCRCTRCSAPGCSCSTRSISVGLVRWALVAPHRAAIVFVPCLLIPFWANHRYLAPMTASALLAMERATSGGVARADRRDRRVAAVHRLERRPRRRGRALDASRHWPCRWSCSSSSMPGACVGAAAAGVRLCTLAGVAGRHPRPAVAGCSDRKPLAAARGRRRRRCFRPISTAAPYRASTAPRASDSAEAVLGGDIQSLAVDPDDRSGRRH